MVNEIRAEFKKVFSVRSTYIIFGLMLVLLIFFGFYVGGWHTDKLDLLDPGRLFSITQQSITFLAIFPALIALLLFTHEFRYNLVSYSLTLSNNRSKVLASKIIVISVIAIAATAVVGILSPFLANLGIHANHLKLVPQHYYYLAMTWRGLVYGWGYAMAGLVIAALIRNQIGAIIALFVVPDTVEGLLSIWLKNNVVYLPFNALHTMLGIDRGVSSPISPLGAMFVFLGYLAFGWIIAWYLFLKKDAL